MNTLLLSLSVSIGGIIILCGCIAQKHPNILSGSSKPNNKQKDFSPTAQQKKYAHQINIIGSVIVIGGLISSFINSEILFLTVIIAPFFYLSLSSLWEDKHQRKNLILPIFLCITFASIPLFLIYASKEANINIDKHQINIKGLYSATIKSSEIEEITLCEKIPIVKKRENGFSFNNVKIGIFATEDNQVAFLFCYGENPPFIHIKTKSSKNYFINFKSKQNTIETYHELCKISISNCPNQH